MDARIGCRIAQSGACLATVTMLGMLAFAPSAGLHAIGT